MTLLRERADRGALPPIVLVHVGTPEEGERFFTERWPEARAVSDPEKLLYADFGLRRGSFAQLFGPRVLAAGLRALRHGIGKPTGDPLMMSGWFLVERDGTLVWSHRHEHAGAERRWSELALARA